MQRLLFFYSVFISSIRATVRNRIALFDIEVLRALEQIFTRVKYFGRNIPTHATLGFASWEALTTQARMDDCV